MFNMHMKIVDVQNSMTKVLSVLHRETGMPLGEIKRRIQAGEYVMTVDLLDLEALRFLQHVMELVAGLGAAVQLYRNDREFPNENLKNMISQYEQTARESQERDDQMLAEEGDGQE